MRDNWKAQGENNSTLLFDKPYAVANADLKMIDFLNKKLAEDPEAVIPDEYRIVTDKEIKFEYKLPEYLPLPDAYKDSMMLLDDLISETIGLHIIEPVSTIVRVKRVVPKPKFAMKELKGKATNLALMEKEKEEKLKKL